MSERAIVEAVDRVVFAVRDLGEAEQVYTRLLGRAPSWRHDDVGGGTAHLIYRLANASLEFVMPKGDGAGAAIIARRLELAGEGLYALILTTADAENAASRLGASGVSAVAFEEGEAQAAQGGLRRRRNVLISPEFTRGLPVLLSEALGAPCVLQPSPLRAGLAEGEAISAFDHLVVMTPDADEVKTLFGDRLGIRLALDHSRPEWGVRQLFFRLGGMTLEVVQPLDASKAPEKDFFWGLAWKVANVSEVRERLLREGADVSEVRVGRKKGTEVATIRKPTCGVPTLLVGPAADAS